MGSEDEASDRIRRAYRAAASATSAADRAEAHALADALFRRWARAGEWLQIAAFAETHPASAGRAAAALVRHGAPDLRFEVGGAGAHWPHTSLTDPRGVFRGDPAAERALIAPLRVPFAWTAARARRFAIGLADDAQTDLPDALAATWQADRARFGDREDGDPIAASALEAMHARWWRAAADAGRRVAAGEAERRLLHACDVLSWACAPRAEWAARGSSDAALALAETRAEAPRAEAARRAAWAEHTADLIELAFG